MGWIFTAVGVMAIGLGGITAGPPVVGCGTVLTRDTTLTTDLVGCSGDALVIGSDGVRLDLDGHTVSSTAGVGVRVEGHDGVTVRDGTIRGAAIGLSAADARRLTIRQVRAEGADLGMSLERVTRSTVLRSTTLAMTGILLVDSQHNRLVAVEAPVRDGSGVHVERSDHNLVSGGRFSGGNDSIRLLDADHNTIVGNDASNSNTVGISLTRSDHNVVRANIGGSEVGAIEVSASSDNLIERNLRSTRYSGGDNEAIEIFASHRTTIRDNHAGDINVRGSSRTVVRHNHADRIRVTASDRTSLRGNVVVADPYRTPFAGIDVSVDAIRSVLRGNLVTGFGGDGIAVAAPGTVLRDNTADDNGDLGIEGVPGVIDGGGNRAAGNGNPAQCRYVACA